ncbi:MAG: alpha-mannosidase, partial [Eubacteriales bacterium]|nr:alpha-mannosidase [Eubacteriales bacterium]
YKSFHLDGQTILIEDYLQVRPENRDRLKKLIEEKRIHIGPWFILQDEFLTSSESNVRNLQIGHQMAREYGEVCKVGYFPDSFGNMGQAPQILKKAGIETAVFGRGVKPTGFNNQVSESDTYESPYSEMYWESEDGSSILGILFANWYSNGIHIPVDEKESKEYWDKKLADAEKFASTSHLLFMNGCDHQPVQTDLSSGLETAKKLYPDTEFIHSNFEQYIEEVKKELKDDLATITGELRSQQTDGWYTLANTASSRIYLKQMNAKCQMLFEKVAEPLATMAHKEGAKYPHHLFKYGWKLLMENHPHDSICGCSVDDVHREMCVRFEKAENVAKHIIDEAISYLKEKIDTSIFEKINAKAVPFVVTNTSADNRSGVVEMEIEVFKKYFKEAFFEDIIKELKEMPLPKYKVVNSKGEEMVAKIEELPDRFNFDLPKDKFREPYIAKRVKLTLEVSEIPSFGFEGFALIPEEAKENKETMVKSEREIETPFYNVKFNKDGSFDLLDKSNNKNWTGLGVFEDCGDIGNEYIYFMPVGEKPITTKGIDAQIKIIEDEPFRATVEVVHTMNIPKKANEVLDQEIQELVEFKKRKAKRVSELIEQKITVRYSFEKVNPVIKAKAEFNNQALDHRIRALFETNLDTNYHYADSIFEIAKRDNVPDKVWENPCNAQHQQAFVNVHTDECGLTIANKGLCEYEILRDGKNTIAITIHRGTRELGDWGVFLTPEAQCLGERSVEFAIIPHGAGKEQFKSYKLAYQYKIDWVTKELNLNNKGNIETKYQLFETNHLEVAHSA